jgi:hypothetical protein
MTIDPTDDATFWYTGEYFDSNNRKTRIASFRIEPEFDNDVGMISVNSPSDGLLGTDEPVTVTIFNFGFDSIFNFPVSYQVNDGTIVTEMYQDTIISTKSAEYTFAQTSDFSTQGIYKIKSYTGYEDDEFNDNDTTIAHVKHVFLNDIGVSVLTSPESGDDLTDAENIEITINNFGGLVQGDFTVYYSINDEAPVAEQFVGELAPGENASFTFTQTADFSFLGTYGITTYTTLADDGDLMNDTNYTVIEHTICMPQANCTLGDGFINFELGDINNPSGCGNDNGVPGYSDFTNLTTQLQQGSDNDWIIRSGYADQLATVWIDFNDNFNFEDDEIVVSNFQFGESFATTSLNIPVDAPIGEHILRARTNWQNEMNDACDNVTYGETEDYTVDIIEAIVDGINQLYNDVNLTVNTLGNGHFEFIIEGLNEKVNIEIHNSIGQTIYNESNIAINGSLNYKIDLSDQATGFFVVKISNDNFIKTKSINKVD